MRSYWESKLYSCLSQNSHYRVLGVIILLCLILSGSIIFCLVNLLIFVSLTTSLLDFPTHQICLIVQTEHLQKNIPCEVQSPFTYFTITQTRERLCCHILILFCCCWQRSINKSSIWSKNWSKRSSCFMFCCIFPDSVSYKTRNNSSLKRSWMTQDSIAPRAEKIAEYSLYWALLFA